MIFTHNIIRAEAFTGVLDSAGESVPPHDVVKRNSGELWLVPHGPITLDGPIDWRHHKREDYVYVPMFPYLLSTEPALALGFMLQLGLRVSFDVGRPVDRLHLAIGNPVNEVLQEGVGSAWQYQVGLALQTR